MENNKQVSSHTPGKAIANNKGAQIFLDDENFILCHVGGFNKTANAARIVECWNDYGYLKAENEKLKADKAVLLEALKELEFQADRYNDLVKQGTSEESETYYTEWNNAIAEAQKAIKDL